MICIVLLWHFGWHQTIIISFKHFLIFATLLHHSTQLCDVLQLQSPFLLSIEFAKSVAQNPDKYVICSWIKKRKNKSEGCINISSYNNIHLLHRRRILQCFGRHFMSLWFMGSIEGRCWEASTRRRWEALDVCMDGGPPCVPKCLPTPPKLRG